PLDHRLRRDGPARGPRRRAERGKAAAATGDLDQLGDPADARDERVVPLLEVDARAVGPHRRVLADLVHFVTHVLDQGTRPGLAAERAADEEHGAQHVVDGARVLQSTVIPLPIRSRTTSFWRSENASTRSGSSARILSSLNVVKPPTGTFSRTAYGRR